MGPVRATDGTRRVALDTQEAASRVALDTQEAASRQTASSQPVGDHLDSSVAGGVPTKSPPAVPERPHTQPAPRMPGMIWKILRASMSTITLRPIRMMFDQVGPKDPPLSTAQVIKRIAFGALAGAVVGLFTSSLVLFPVGIALAAAGPAALPILGTIAGATVYGAFMGGLQAWRTTRPEAIHPALTAQRNPSSIKIDADARSAQESLLAKQRAARVGLSPQPNDYDDGASAGTAPVADPDQDASNTPLLAQEIRDTTKQVARQDQRARQDLHEGEQVLKSNREENLRRS